MEFVPNNTMYYIYKGLLFQIIAKEFCDYTDFDVIVRIGTVYYHEIKTTVPGINGSKR